MSIVVCDLFESLDDRFELRNGLEFSKIGMSPLGKSSKTDSLLSKSSSDSAENEISDCFRLFCFFKVFLEFLRVTSSFGDGSLELLQLSNVGLNVRFGTGGGCGVGTCGNTGTVCKHFCSSDTLSMIGQWCDECRLILIEDADGGARLKCLTIFTGLSSRNSTNALFGNAKLAALVDLNLNDKVHSNTLEDIT